MKKYLLSLFLLLTIVFTFSACACNASDKNSTGKNEKKTGDTYLVKPIVEYNESTDASDSKALGSITYVSVDGLGEACGMGGHHPEFAVGVRANPKPGYQYADCKSDTIEFYEYAPNESLGYDVPWFKVPDSGEHVIYVYYEPIE